MPDNNHCEAATKAAVPWVCLLLELQAWLLRGSLSTVALYVTAEGDYDARGRIISSYYLGYSLFLLPAGIATQILGGHRVLALGLASMCVALLLAPSFGVNGLSACLFACGACTSPLMPGKSMLLTRWFARSETAEALAIIKSGNLLGKIFSSVAAVFLAERYGWEAVVYANGASSAVVLALWCALLEADAPPKTATAAAAASGGEGKGEGGGRATPQAGQAGGDATAALALVPRLLLGAPASVLVVISTHVVHNFGSYALSNFGLPVRP